MNPCELFRNKAASMIENSESVSEWPQPHRAHLDSCKACRLWLEEFYATEEILREAAAGAPEISEAAHARILDAIHREPTPGRSSGSFWRVSLPFAAAILICLAGAAYLMRTPPRAEDSVATQTTIPPAREASDAPDQLAHKLLQPPRVIVSARDDFSWLKQTVIENAASAARAFGATDAVTPSPQSRPSPRPES